MPAERTEASRRFGIPRSAPRRRGARTRGEARGARTRDPRGTRPPRAGATRGAHPGWSSRDASVRRAPRATRRALENASVGCRMRGNPGRRADSPRATARAMSLSSSPRARAAVATRRVRLTLAHETRPSKPAVVLPLDGCDPILRDEARATFSPTWTAAQSELLAVPGSANPKRARRAVGFEALGRRGPFSFSRERSV